VGAPVEGAAGCSEGPGVGVGACSWLEVFSFTVLHLDLFFFVFHWHALSATHDASSEWERQGSVGLQATRAIVSPEIAKTHFIVALPTLTRKTTPTEADAHSALPMLLAMRRASSRVSNLAVAAS
jgi:hypothetical protein